MKTKSRLVIELDPEIRSAAKSAAYAEEKTLKQKVTELIKDWLRKDGQ